MIFNAIETITMLAVLAFAVFSSLLVGFGLEFGAMLARRAFQRESVECGGNTLKPESQPVSVSQSEATSPDSFYP